MSLDVLQRMFKSFNTKNKGRPIRCVICVALQFILVEVLTLVDIKNQSIWPKTCQTKIRER